MIKVTRFNGQAYVINADLIEFIEETPDTVVSLVTGRKVLVKEAADEIIELVIEYRRRVGCHPTTVTLKEEKDDQETDKPNKGKR